MALEAIDASGALSSAGADLAERLRPGVVQVRTGGRGRAGHGAGAGTVWTLDGSPDGHILTNHHVVAGSQRARVTLYDGREFDAGVVDRSPELDLALLRLREAPEDLRAVMVGDSGALRVGELVLAVGSPWGRRGAVTAGIVSAVGLVPGWHGRNDYIQSDVALAPGNSGGPLLNARGEVVGINAMIAGGMALAIPTAVASEWIQDPKTPRPPPRPRIGVALRPAGVSRGRGRRRWRRWQDRGQSRTPGWMVVGVEEDGPAARSGLLVGDVLLQAGGEPVDGAFPDLVARSAGQTLRLDVSRGGSKLTVDVGVPGNGS